MILWNFVTSCITVDEKHVKNGAMDFKIFTLITSAFRNNTFECGHLED
jgi:hypothetical protein